MERLAINPNGGINRRDHRTRLRPDEAFLTKNMYVGKDGVLQLRPGSEQYGTLSYPHFGGIYPTSIRQILAPRGSAADFVSVAKYPARRTVLYGALGTMVSSGADVPVVRTIAGRLSFVDDGRFVYGVSGEGFGFGTVPPATTTAILRFDYSGAASTVATLPFAGMGNNDLVPRLVALYRNRFVYLDLKAGKEDYVVISDRYEPAVIGDDVLAANGRSFRVGNANDGRIVTAVEVMQTGIGTPAQSALLILRERAAYLLMGEPELSTYAGEFPLGNMELARMSIDAGCASADTVVRTPYGILWASEDDVWLFDVGSLPRKVGGKIGAFLSSQHATKRPSWHAVWDGSYYRLAYTVGGGAAVAVDDIVPCDREVWLDLSRGAPASADDARWYGSMEYPVPSMHKTVDVSSGFPKVLMMPAYLTPTGGASLVDINSAGAGDNNAVADNDGHFIPWVLTTKDYQAEDPTMLMQMHGVDLVYDMSEQDVQADLYNPTQLMANLKHIGDDDFDTMDATAFNVGEPETFDQPPGAQMRANFAGVNKSGDATAASRVRIFQAIIKYDIFPRTP